ncbi:hypothetical protein HBI56_135170 [Parastagonospora nodorum]|uniref:Uncharacterized protein n=1 Tax=Phaeosphaeria nodorum (strain SN15 / ATCC MYA-4574 / FGSC 10173) TaxID=321614 RepID=A0A7U2F7E4_PHANO|nr:hypothetical protein HBH56_038270 [Parastagonospora nodorum]QRC99876.1 hypothetical protein JI435_437640 [Parastagonospora nodorum SN15]KAH3933683.1 hypothetical protein HBH54_061190 [Parastagonospora nodorum]KAH3952560.1 hypothetical protein HBH53_048920 [Parastagonospora nodorum]KAH3979869.1 hypothetical protein HBH51_059930 [Parastagonospora nodorum]
MHGHRASASAIHPDYASYKLLPPPSLQLRQPRDYRLVAAPNCDFEEPFLLHCISQ